MGDSICDFAGAKTIEEGNVLTKYGFQIFPHISAILKGDRVLANTTTDTLTTDDPAYIRDIHRHQNPDTKIKKIECESGNLINVSPRLNRRRNMGTLELK